MGQITIQNTIDYLNGLSVKEIQSYSAPHSYRGYYCDLALSVDDGLTMTPSALVALLESCIGKTYEGYKGGDFTMSYGSDVWASEYGMVSEISLIQSIKDYLLNEQNKLQKGSVIQANEQCRSKGWIGALLMVDEVKPFGVMAFVQVPVTRDESNQAYIRLQNDEFDLIGQAKLIPQE